MDSRFALEFSYSNHDAAVARKAHGKTKRPQEAPRGRSQSGEADMAKATNPQNSV